MYIILKEMSDIDIVDNALESVENTYSDQRIINVDKLEGVYNEILTSYLDNYEQYLKNKSKLINDTPELAQKYRYRILKDNHKLLTIIRALYNNIKHTDEEHTNTKTKNSERRNLIKKNKKTLEKQRKLLLGDKDELLTKETRLNQLESLYRGKYQTYTGVFITDIVIGILLLLMLVFALK